jgi:hypothetical protein
MWTPWVASAGLGGRCLALLTASWSGWLGGLVMFLLVAVGSLFAMFLLATLVFAIKLRGMEVGGIILERKHVVIDGAGIAVKGSASQGLFGWDTVEDVRPRSRFLFVKLRGAQVILMWPRRDVPADALERIKQQRDLHARGAAA